MNPSRNTPHMNWLDTEINAAVRSVRQSHLDRLTSLGVSPKAIAVDCH